VAATASATVHRTRLTKRLAPELCTGLVLLVSQAGYGKSALLAEWSPIRRLAAVNSGIVGIVVIIHLESQGGR